MTARILQKAQIRPLRSCVDGGTIKVSLIFHEHDIDYRYSPRDITALLQKALRELSGEEQLRTKKAREVLAILRKCKKVLVEITLTHDAQVRKLNKQYRKLDKTTDVLSFSLADSGLVPAATIHLGDIIVSWEMIVLQAQRFKVPVDQELKRILVHGFLHLLGFDHVHVSAALRDEMRSFEDRMLVKESPNKLRDS